MTVLVTGGAGFIGSHLVEALLGRGEHVRVLDNFSSGYRANLSAILSEIELIEGDIADAGLVSAAAAGCHTIYHQAALVSVPKSIREPELNHKSNVTGTFNVVQAARLNGVGRLVYASSAAVYGNTQKLPSHEEDPTEPLTPYAAAKLIGEIMLSTYTETYSIETVCLRYMNVYGPRQDPSSPYSGVLSIFSKAALGDGRVKIFGDGEQTRDFVHVSDVVEANLLAGTTPYDRMPTSAVFNVGRGVGTSLNQIVDVFGAIRGELLAVTYEAARGGDIRHSAADLQRIRACLGYDPKVELESGLRDTMTGYE